MDKEEKGANWFKKHKILTAIIGVIILAIAVGSSSQKDVETDKSSGAESSNVTKAASPYKQLALLSVQDIRDNVHYQYTGDGKPTVEQVKQYMVEIEKKGCSHQICNYFLWDSLDAFNSAKDNVDEGLADEIAIANKEHLIGYVNSGYLFFFNGVSPSAYDNGFVVLDPDTGTYTDFKG